MSSTSPQVSPRLALVWPVLSLQTLSYFLLPLFIDTGNPYPPIAPRTFWIAAAWALIVVIWGLFRLVFWIQSGSRATGSEPTFGPIVPSNWRRRTGLAGTEWLLTFAVIALAVITFKVPFWAGWSICAATILVLTHLLVPVEKNPVLPSRDIPEGPPGEDLPEEGTVRRSWAWTSHAREKEARVDLALRTALYEKRKTENPFQPPAQPPSDGDDWARRIRSVVELGAADAEVAEAARQLLAFARSERFNYFEEAQNTLQFVQAVQYKGDHETRGCEYTRFAIETLYDDAGDCDCKAALAATIFRLMGLRSVVLISFSEEHAAVAVEGAPDFETGYFVHNGRNFYFCETTAGNFSLTVGQIPPGLNLNSYNVRIDIEPKLFGSAGKA